MSRSWFLFQDYRKVLLDPTSLSFAGFYSVSISMKKHNYHLPWVSWSTRSSGATACMTFKKYHVSKQNLPLPERYGWEINGTSLERIMKDNLAAPLSLIELSISNCKGGCNTQICKCFKNSLVYTDLCKCSACNNSDTIGDNNQEIFEYNKSDIEDYTWHYLFDIFIVKIHSKNVWSFHDLFLC